MSDTHKRNLAVPFFTQRDNTYVWQRKTEEGKIWKDKNGQEGSKYPMAWRTCNITSLCMILHYWGLTEETPNQMVENIFAKNKEGEGKNAKWGWLYEANSDAKHEGASRLENWSNLKDIAELYIEGKEGFSVTRGQNLSMPILETEIAKGCPVMISTGLGKYINNNSHYC